MSTTKEPPQAFQLRVPHVRSRSRCASGRITRAISAATSAGCFGTSAVLGFSGARLPDSGSAFGVVVLRGRHFGHAEGGVANAAKAAAVRRSYATRNNASSACLSSRTLCFGANMARPLRTPNTASTLRVSGIAATPHAQVRIFARGSRISPNMAPPRRRNSVKRAAAFAHSNKLSTTKRWSPATSSASKPIDRTASNATTLGFAASLSRYTRISASSAPRASARTSTPRPLRNTAAARASSINPSRALPYLQSHSRTSLFRGNCGTETILRWLILQECGPRAYVTVTVGADPA